MVELESLDRVVRVSDNLGWIALEPEQETVWFHVRSHGYRLPADGFGFRGLALRPTAGETRTVALERTQPASRVGRLTGADRYRDSQRLGKVIPESHDPFVGIVGMDSSQSATLRGRRWWFWGDTTVRRYPLGNFRTTGAEVRLRPGPPSSSNPPRFSVIRAADGRPAAMLPGTEPGMVWISGATEVGRAGSARLLAYYSRMRDLGTRLEHGHVDWDPQARRFRIVARIENLQSWRHLEGHPIRLHDRIDWIAGGFTFPVVRVADSVDAIVGDSGWEAFTCLDPSGSVRRTGGTAAYRWVRDTPPIEPRKEMELVENGSLSIAETRFLPRSATGEIVLPHGGSVVWNSWRRRWICIFTRMGGKSSRLGEVWYAEAQSPVGPWRSACRVASHENHSFYNPVLHPFLNQAGDRVVHFEGTYTEQFADNPRPTPRYDYNQVLYRLDLADPALVWVRGTE